MAHPYKNMSAEKVGKDRAKEMTKGYKRGGKVNVNINIHPNTPGLGKPMVPPLPLAGPPMGPPGPLPGGPPVPPGVGAGPFKRGGKVSPMKAGADTGEGRIQKGKWYGG